MPKRKPLIRQQQVYREKILLSSGEGSAISVMRPGPVHGVRYAPGGIANEVLAGIPIAPTNHEREQQLGIAIDSSPQPEVAAIAYALVNPLAEYADILPFQGRSQIRGPSSQSTPQFR